uniref:Uncharacterized protein n=1 Tax=Fervidobacterium pennivorans TaxID=93466 RepID=A0A7V4KBS6_FERPE
MNFYDFFSYLKQALYLPEEIELKWIPTENCKYRGYVTKDSKTIFIFDKNEEEAKKTLIHESIELLIVRLAQCIVNPEIARNNKELYNLKEAVVEVIRQLITEEEVIKKGSMNEIIRLLKEAGRDDLIE